MGEQQGARTPSASRIIDWFAPLTWAALAWAIIIVASDAESQTFNLAQRGVGIIQYTTAILASHPEAVLGAFLAAVVLAAAAHLLLLSQKGWPVWVPLLALAALLSSAALEVLVTPFALLLTASALGLLAIDGAARIRAGAGNGTGAFAVTFFFVPMALLAAISAARWILGGIDGTTPFSGLSWYLPVTSAQLLGTLNPVLPEIVLLFFFSWAIRLGVGSNHILTWTADDSPMLPPVGKLPLLLLLGGVATAIFVGAYPYLSAVNPSSTLVGVDVRACYSHLLQNLPVTSPCGNSPVSYGDERAGAFWVLEGLKWVTGSANAALEVAPALWGSFLVVTTFLLVREGTADGALAGVAALLTGVSSEIIVGIDAGLMADWLGLSLAFLFLAVVLRGMRTRRLWYLAPSFVVFVALLFTHPWTWTVTLGVLGLFLVVDLAQAAATRKLKERRFELGLSLSLVALGAAADLGRSVLPAGSGFVLAINTVLPYLSPSNAPIAAANLVQSLGTYLGGAQADPVWFIFGAVGVLSIPSLHGRFGRLLACWVGAMSLGVVFVGPPSNLLQSRMVYDVPIQIFAAVGVMSLVAFVHRGVVEVGLRWSRYASVAIVSSVFMLALGFALEYVGFLYL